MNNPRPAFVTLGVALLPLIALPAVARGQADESTGIHSHLYDQFDWRTLVSKVTGIADNDVTVLEDYVAQYRDRGGNSIRFLPSSPASLPLIEIAEANGRTVHTGQIARILYLECIAPTQGVGIGQFFYFARRTRSLSVYFFDETVSTEVRETIEALHSEEVREADGQQYAIACTVMESFDR